MLLEAYPKAVEVPNDYGDLPLHIACKTTASCPIVEMLLNLYPDAAQIQNNFGCLPLHQAIDKSTSLDILHMLLRVYPKAVQVKDYNNGDLPLHLATYKNASEDVIKILFQTFPKAATITNNFGKTPLDYAHSHKMYTDLLQLFHQETKPAQKIFETNLDPNSHSDEPNELLDLCKNTCQRKDDESHRKIEIWLDKNRENENLVREAVSYQDEHGKVPVHYLAGTNIPCNVIGKMLRFAPEVAKIQDCDGNLPLHCACLNKRPSPDIFNMLIDSFPESITVKNTDGKLPKDLVVYNLDLKSLLCEATLPEPYKHGIRHRNELIIDNKTGRRLRVEGFHPFPPNFFLAGDRLQATFPKYGVRIKFNKRNYRNMVGRATSFVLKPNEKLLLTVPKTCDGLCLDVYGNTGFSCGWTLRHFFKRGYTQTICGQPIKFK
jgi:ankyrin repeat protein